MKYIIPILLISFLFGCRKIEKRLEGSWFVEYFENDLKTMDFNMDFEEDGTGQIDGATPFKWSVSKKELTLNINDVTTVWENNRNKKNEQFFLTTDSTGTFVRMEMDRIK